MQCACITRGGWRFSRLSFFDESILSSEKKELNDYCPFFIDLADLK